MTTVRRAVLACIASSALAAPALVGASGGGAQARPSAAQCVHVGQWSLGRLAAQTVVVPVEETDVASVEPLVARGAGGVILFGSSAPADLGAQLRALRRAVPDRLGLLVMTDEEGGGVQRMANLVGGLPWARYMGLHWTPRTIRRHVAAVAQRMAAVGVNTDLAPVVDVDGRDVAPGPADPDGWRSFGGRTALVSADGIAYLQGLLQGGVLPTLKHFPGLGGASRNTDYGTAYTLPWARLRRVGLPPFVAGIRAGAPVVMVSNAIVPGLTRLPASLSVVAITRELDRTLHFTGLVVTDSLSAGAISQAGFHVPGAAVAAVEAGADMVEYNAADAAVTTRIFHDVVVAEANAVRHGAMPRSRLAAAARAALVARHVGVCT